MHLHLSRALAWSLAIASILAGLPRTSLAAELSVAGKWKMIILPAGREISYWLVKIEDKDGTPQASILAAGHPNLANAKVTACSRNGRALHLTIQTNGVDFALVVYGSENEEAPSRLLGFMENRGQREFARLERTDLEELDPQKVVVQSPGVQGFLLARKETDAKKKEAGLKEVMEQTAGQTLAILAGLELLPVMAENAAAQDAIRAQADKVIKSAADYGPEMKLQATHIVAQQFVRMDKFPDLAIDYARHAEKLLGESTPAAQQVPVLKTLLSALRKGNKGEEANEVKARLTRLNRLLDEEFAKTAIPFKPEASSARLGKSDRVVLLELFTGAQCGPCVAADVAFDALQQTYKPADLVLLQYHLHVPAPDPLTNADSESRSRDYQLQGTPMAYIDGKDIPNVGGFKQHAKDRYDAFVKAVDEQRERMPKAQIQLAAKRTKGEIAITANVSGLKKTGDAIRLRLVLAEDVVSYAGGNGQRLHHHVVRAFPGGVDGLSLKESSAKQEAAVKLEELRKTLKSYLDSVNKKRKFFDEDQPLDLKHLKVVAFVQDDETKEVFQAAQVDLADAE
jgi:hypothetical protein